MKKIIGKRALSLLLSAALLITQMGVPVFAQEAKPDASGLCEHHTEHTPECGYNEGAPCTHEHTEDCYRIDTVCTFIASDEVDVSENTATPSNPPEQTEHECTEESGCVTKMLGCKHEHDEACGFAEPSPCTYKCEICAAMDSGDVTIGVSSITVTGFDELEEAVRQRTVPAGTELAALNLPDTLKATGFEVAEDTAVVDSGTAPVTTPAAITIEGVTWELDPTNEANNGNSTYDPAQGSYAFTPVLPEKYTLAADVALPEIWVMVGGVNLLTAGDIAYIDANGQPQTAAGATEITADSLNSNATLNAGWYYVDGTITRTGTITVNGNVHLILVDGCDLIVTGSDGEAGIKVSQSNSLAIYGQLGGTGQLIATGGTIGYAGAGIGGGGSAKANGGTITINGGIVRATGGKAGAGIGAGDEGSGGTVTINGGAVSATGGENGAGIGGAWGGAGGTVTINGGTVTATGGSGGAGIGGHSASGGIITINGGKVTANGGGYGAGIGGGGGAEGGTIAISGGTITANGGVRAAGIGGGGGPTGGGSSGTIAINGGTVTATSGPTGVGSTRGADIGGGYWSTGGNITINGGIVTAAGGQGIGGSGSTFSTGTAGNAVIITKSISDTSYTSNSGTQGVIIVDKTGTVYGSPTPTEDFEIPSDVTLTIDSGKTLTLGSGVTLTNNGTITVNGTLNTSNGIFNNFGTMNGNGTKPDESATNHINAKVELAASPSPATYNSSVTLTATVTEQPATNSLAARTAIPQKTVVFYRGEVEIGRGTPSGTPKTASITFTPSGEDWKPGTYQITAKYGGGDDNLLPATSNTLSLVVNRMAQTATSVTVSSTTLTYGDAAPTITPVTTSESAGVTYSAVTDTTGSTSSPVASISGTTITINKAGTFYVKAVIAQTSHYEAKTIYSSEITVNKAKIAKAITVGTAAPVNGAAIANGTNNPPANATGPVVSWSDDNGSTWTASGNFKQKTAYQTKYVYTATANYVFDSSIAAGDITVANLGGGSKTVALSDSNTTLTVTVTWPATDASVLTGTVNISGTLKYNQTLTATLTGSNNTGTLSYQWKRGDGNISGATSQTYTTVAADIGQILSCEVKSSVESGTQTGTATGTIGKGTQTVTQGISYGATTFTYGDAQKALTTTPTFSQSGTISYSSSDSSVISVAADGKLTFNKASSTPVTITATNVATNYENATSTVSITVNRAALTVTWPTATTITYGATLSTSTLSGGSANGTFRWSDGTQTPTVTNTGYDVVFTPSDTANYDYSGVDGWDGSAKTVTKKVSITVNRATPTITWPTASAITYGAKLSGSTLSGGSASGGGTFAWSAGDTAPTVTNGGYDVVFTPSDTDNYDYSGVTGWNGSAKTVTQKVSITVNRAALTVTAKPHSITYGAVPANNGVTYSGFVNIESATDLTGSLAYDYSYTQYGNVGSYTITPKGYTSDNYTISYVAGTLTVNQKEVGLTWSNATGRKYGDGKTVTAAATNTVNSDVIAVTVSGGDQTAVGGSYTATATGLTGTKAGNYKLPSGTTQSYSIGKADALNLSGSATMIKNQSNYKVEVDLTKVSSYPTTPGGTPAFSITSNTTNGLTSAAVDGSTLTLMANNTNNDTADTVTVKVSGMGNYADSTITIAVSYTAKTPVTITGVSAASNLTYNGQPQQGYTGTPTSAYTGDYDISYAGTGGTNYTSTTAPTNAGNYAVTFKVPDSDATYSGTATVNFTIGKKSATVKPENKSVKTGDTMPSFNLVYDGLISGETLTPSATPAFSCTAADTSTAGDYTITWSNMSGVSFTGAVADNYSITKVETATLAIAEQIFTLTVSGGGTGATTSGSHASGTTVSINAGTKSGYTFTEWTGSVVFADKNSASTTFTMPEQNVTITANWRYNGGGGGSTGGNDDTPSYTPPTVTTPPTTPEQPNPPTNGETKLPGKVEGGNATVTVPDKNITDAINAAKKQAGQNGISVTVNIQLSQTANSLTATISKVALDKLIAEGVKELKFESGLVSFSFDLDALKEMQKSVTDSLTITAKKLDVKTLSKDAQEAIGSRPAFDFTITGGGKAITSFGKGSASVWMPYMLATAETAGYVQAVYVDADGKVQWLPRSSYDSKTKMMMLSTGRFSVYGVGYRQDAPKFTDITDHWAKSDIEFVAARGLMSGTSKTAFSPNAGMTRGMFVTALGRLAGIDSSKYKNTKFTDVSAAAYYAPYIAWAAEEDITNGTSATTFSPDKTITRQELAVLMQNYAKAMGYTVPKTREEVRFADSASIASWAKDAVKTMQMAGVMNGKDNNRFDPTATATRAEVAATLHRYVELVIDIQTAQGLDVNDSGSAVMYENGKAVKSASRTTGGNTYNFNYLGEAALPPTKKTGTYTVKKGDSFWLIASKVGCTIAELEALNGKSRNTILYAGQVLKVPTT